MPQGLRKEQYDQKRVLNKSVRMERHMTNSREHAFLKLKREFMLSMRRGTNYLKN